MIQAYNKSSEEIIQAIRDVALICKEHDTLQGGLFLDTSLNFNSEINSMFLLYKDNKLVSFLSMFLPTSEAAEITAYTLPAYRKKGAFTQLLEQAVAELKKYSVSNMIFVCEPQSLDGIAAIHKLQATLDFSEYTLRYQISSRPTLSQNRRVALHVAVQQDLEALIALSQDVFEDSYEDARNIVMKSFTADNRVQYIAKLNGVLMGMGTVSFENNEASISGFGVSPHYQGQGLGKEILHCILEDLHGKGIEQITIDVHSTNQGAFHLYKACGFHVEATFHYYRKAVR
ncbi:GNAT family N-acetyltransferase [Ectobacillus sp. JY-23]|uniref:GNAT family N-acetyltransferase n=1 Tax=Ectobacillus sp. JY-23 TaxID=2933872 RepID=UPI001FF33919|nr:GNAT family N-acetyltransferase [Ectobacillus sp. JY-23]UOY92589.1 GNAT family N-acetyltransferase [Ectobacillus sp. JY-23]